VIIFAKGAENFFNGSKEQRHLICYFTFAPLFKKLIQKWSSGGAQAEVHGQPQVYSEAVNGAQRSRMV
jgi:hypothetical protein